MNNIYDNYHFFLKGELSQWSKSPFYDQLLGIEFNCCEQYMMYKKAILFGDKDIAKEILNTKSPRTQKDLGRQVKNFDLNIWNNCKIEIVFRGNILKFQSNKIHNSILSDTYPKILVEVNPWDAIWGIALDEKRARKILPENWPGQNLLGKILTEVRDLNINNIKEIIK